MRKSGQVLLNDILSDGFLAYCLLNLVLALLLGVKGPNSSLGKQSILKHHRRSGMILYFSNCCL